MEQGCYGTFSRTVAENAMHDRIRGFYRTMRSNDDCTLYYRKDGSLIGLVYKDAKPF